MSVHENLTIVFTDIVDFTRLTSEYTRAQMGHLMRVHDEVLLPVVAAYSGKLVKTIGDSLLLTFRSPTNAVLCGMAIQDAIAQRRAEDPGIAELHLRIAVSLGEVRRERGDIFGEAVNIASRIESLTPADQVYLAEAVFLAMSKADVPVEDLGTRELRGVTRPVRIYAARGDLPGWDDSDSGLATLPFGGMHLRRPARPGLRYRSQALLRSLWATRSAQVSRRLMTGIVGAVAAGVASVVLTIAITSLRDGELTPPIQGAEATAAAPAAKPTHLPVSTAAPAWLSRGTELLGDDEAVTARIQQGLADPQLHAVALQLLGHQEFAHHDPLAALASYREALAAPNAVAEDAQLADNLVAMLSQHTADVESLIHEYPSAAIIGALARRSGEAGFYGRYHAVRILKDLHHEDSIRWFDYAVEEIRGRSDCKDRLAAVNILGKLGDKRAIPILKEARGEGVSGWFRNRCLRTAAEQWIDRLEKAES